MPHMMLPRALAYPIVFCRAFVVIKRFKSQHAVAQILFDKGYDTFSEMTRPVGGVMDSPGCLPYSP